MAASWTASTRSFWPSRLSGIIGCGSTRRARKSAGPLLQFIKGNDCFVKQLAILGSTGSIGRQCLSVVDALAPRVGGVALAAGGDLGEVVGEVQRHPPGNGLVGDSPKADALAAP